MLILTRRIGEGVVLGDNEINFTILGVQGNQVRLGFNAPKHIPINRDEIYLRLQLEKQQNQEEKAFVLDDIAVELLDEQSTKTNNETVTH
ncbi:carbon storage regulator CsrA [Legionella drancourtii]|uniref:Translational regulator CsrA n=1 Tax=Legionella drancourtii LLAP12 TaxID=658187 RepID=G9EQC9_9GAMM|nr:hypothetical protein LDG_7476 [Legionella drancourtii LLAP12]